MTRLVKPNAGVITRASDKIVDSGDGAWYPIVGGAASLFSSIMFAFNIDESLLFFPLLAPVLFYLTTIFAYFTGTFNVGSSCYDGNRSHQYNMAAYVYWPKLRGTFAESYAKPLFEQIYQHTADGHGESCKLCEERLNLMKELVPRKASDKTDITNARLFIEERKKYELES